MEKKRQQVLKEAEEQRLQAEKYAEQREKEEKLIVQQDNRKEEEEMDNVLAQEEIEAGDQISPMKDIHSTQTNICTGVYHIESHPWR